MRLDLDADSTAHIAQRFWKKVKMVDDPLDACWEWTATVSCGGYGHFNVLYTIYKAHRIAWVLTYGEVPDGLAVLHTCDNKRCVRPSHLYADSLSRNQRDRRDRLPPLRQKLDWDKVNAIRERYAAGEIDYERLGEEYGVSRTTIRQIVTSETWQK